MEQVQIRILREDGGHVDGGGVEHADAEVVQHVDAEVVAHGDAEVFAHADAEEIDDVQHVDAGFHVKITKTKIAVFYKILMQIAINFLT